jgi:hypothetical protein
VIYCILLFYPSILMVQLRFYQIMVKDRVYSVVVNLNLINYYHRIWKWGQGQADKCMPTVLSVINAWTKQTWFSYVHSVSGQSINIFKFDFEMFLYIYFYMLCVLTCDILYIVVLPIYPHGTVKVLSGENTEIYSSLKLLHWLNLNCALIIGRSFTNFVFFMLIVIRI